MRQLCALAAILVILGMVSCSHSDSSATTEEPQSPALSGDASAETASEISSDLATDEQQKSADTADAESDGADAPQEKTRFVQTKDKNLEVIDQRSNDAALAKGEINFDDLKFDIEKDAPFDDEMITDSLRKLEGRNVKLRGYILPSTLFSETDISQFVLVRDNQECCFGPGAALFDCVMIQMVDGATTDFVTRPVTVEGTFEIDTESYRYPPGTSPTGASHLAIFRIQGKDVK